MIRSQTPALPVPLLTVLLPVALALGASAGAPESPARPPSSDGGSAEAAASPAGDAADAEVRVAEAVAVDGDLPYKVDRGESRLPLVVPEGEKLVYDVHVAWGVIGAALGTVTLTSGVEPYRRSLLVARSEGGGEDDKTAWMLAHAYGKHLLYTMDAKLEARHQPQEWPRIVYRSTQEGTEQRRREMLLGRKDGKWMSSYRRDTDDSAPRGTRIWKEPELREIPEHTLDMTSAVYLMRSLVLSDRDRVVIPVIQKEELWEITLELGRTRVQETKVGSYEAVEIDLQARRWPGEQEEDEDFEGLFGLRGGIELWVDKHTGIPVRVLGEVPAGPVLLDVDIVLADHSGTPRAFRPVPRRGE